MLFTTKNMKSIVYSVMKEKQLDSSLFISSTLSFLGS
uniref:Uncharacterized protein n=1 Tax=Arundo donax TaxID=35708 RepID=A0A0A9FGX6_ARUDO